MFDLCLISFATEAEVILKKSVSCISSNDIPILKHNGVARFDLAIEKAEDVIAAYKEMRLQEGMGYYRPHLIIISDGIPTNDEEQYLDEDSKEKIAERVKTLSEGRHMNCMTCYVGNDNDGISFMEKLATSTALAVNILDKDSVRRMFSGLGCVRSDIPVMGPKHELADIDTSILRPTVDL